VLLNAASRTSLHHSHSIRQSGLILWLAEFPSSLSRDPSFRRVGGLEESNWFELRKLTKSLTTLALPFNANSNTGLCGKAKWIAGTPRSDFAGPHTGDY
jgi:hypothetical protein